MGSRWGHTATLLETLKEMVYSLSPAASSIFDVFTQLN